MLALLLGGCAAGNGVERLASDNFDRVRPGVSRESDVRELLGQPKLIQSFPRQERVAWTYPAPGVQSTLFVVQFSKDGVVREVYTLDDPDYAAGD
jgi:outer membrane protein assembly factor BamE (lipoprotein component of BamABCDE complex)